MGFENMNVIRWLKLRSVATSSLSRCKGEERVCFRVIAKKKKKKN